MATAQIEINGSPGSDIDLELGQVINLSNVDDTGVATWLWELLDKPAGSASALTTPNAATSTLTPDKVGSYLIKLTVNVNEDEDQVVAAVKTLRNRIRIPAGGEQREADSTIGWAASRNLDLNQLETILGEGSIVVGLIPAAEAPPDSVSWKKGNIVAASTFVDVDPSAGTLVVPIWRKPATVLSGGGKPNLIGVVISDTEGNESFDQAVTNIPGIAAGRSVRVKIQGFVKGITGALDFSSLPFAVNAGDPLWITTDAAKGYEFINFNDSFGANALNLGGTDKFDKETYFLGYIIDAGNPGSLYITAPINTKFSTAPIRFDNGLVAYSLKLAQATYVNGAYEGTKPINTAPGAIEVDTYDIQHGQGIVLFDIVSLQPEDAGSGNNRAGMLHATLADQSSGETSTYLGMVTNVGGGVNIGETIKAAIYGFIFGCAAVFPVGAVNGETLYLDPSNPGKLERYTNLTSTERQTAVAVGRIYSTTLLSGVFFIGPDINLRKETQPWIDGGTFVFPNALKQVVIGANVQGTGGQYDVEIVGSLYVFSETNKVIIETVQPTADSGIAGFDIEIKTAEGADGGAAQASTKGGDIKITTGAGGIPNSTQGGGSRGGIIDATLGNGAIASSSANPGIGGGVDLLAGGGGANLLKAGAKAGKGGSIILQAGPGGKADIVVADGGDGGDVVINPGNKGSSTTASDGAAGDLTLASIGKNVHIGQGTDGILNLKSLTNNIFRSLMVNGLQLVAVTSQLADNYFIYAATNVNITLTIPTVMLANGKFFIVFDLTGAASQANPITIDTQGAELINKVASVNIEGAFGWYLVVSDGTDWYALAGGVP